MNCRKTSNRISLIALSIIAVIFFMCSITLNNAQAQFLFEARIDYGAGESPSSVAIGDLNGDDALDLAVANARSANVSVLLGNNDGSFQSAVNYGAGDYPRSVAIGDLNGDGNPDLAVANWWSDNVSVLLGNGDGSFQSAVNYDTPCGSRSVAIGDLNGDGDPDLAVASESGVLVMLGNGDGSFQSAVNYDAGDSPSSVAIGDLNGDDDLDLAAADASPNTKVWVLLGNGDGSFQSAVNYGGTSGVSVAIGDLDGDAKPDLAVANGSSANVSVLLGNGDGSFQSAVNYGAGNRPFSVGIGDLNGDGDLDLAVANYDSNNVSVLLGNGDGSFQSAVNYGTGSEPSSVAIGDLNGDGPPDLATANYESNNVSVLINTGEIAKFLYTPVTPCRIVDTRKTSAGIIGASTQRNFRVYGSGGTMSAQGGNPAGCSSPLGQPLAAHINMVAVNPTGKGNLQAFPVGAGTGAGLSVNYNTIDTNLANGGTVKTVTGSGADITVASNFSSAHTAIDVLGYYYPDGELLYTAVTPCRIVDTRKTSAGIIDASMQRNFRVYGSGSTISAQGGNPAGCPSPLGQPLAAHINMVAVNPTGKGNLQAFPVGAGTGAGLSVNYNTIDTNLANAGTVKSITGTGPDITVASNFSSAHTAIDVLGYYYSNGDLLYTALKPCRIVDTRKTTAGIIDANTQRDFRVFGPVGGQGGNPAGCSSPQGQPLAAHINMIAVNPTGKGNLQAFPVGAGTGAGLSVNYNTIDTNLANAGTVKTVTSSGPDITVASNFSSAHTVIDVLGYYYFPAKFAHVPKTGQTESYASGDDGYLQMGVPWPEPRFTDNNDGTVTDHLTGLVWLKNADCFGWENWNAALQVSNNLTDGQCGLSDGSNIGDWRLPNIKELYSLIDRGHLRPVLPSGHPFTGVQFDYYWASTSRAHFPNERAWSVYMNNGHVGGSNYKDEVCNVWPVRSGNSVPVTGQTQSYAPGDDGDLKMGVHWPTPRFTDNGNGTVTDHLTGLVWLKNADCFGWENWNAALQVSNNLTDGQCGLSDDSSIGDWRLPNVNELYSLIDHGHANPALPSGHPFTGVRSDYYWTSTSRTQSPYERAYTVYMQSGMVESYYYYKDEVYNVWPVRSGS